MKKHRLQEISSVDLRFQCPMCSPSDIRAWTKRALERHAKIGHQMGLKRLYDIAYGKAVGPTKRPTKPKPVVLLTKSATKRPRKHGIWNPENMEYDLRLPKRTTDSSHWDIVEGSIGTTHMESRQVSGPKAGPNDKTGTIKSFMSLMDKGELKCLECKVMFCDKAGLIGHMALVHQMDVKPFMRRREMQIVQELNFEDGIGKRHVETRQDCGSGPVQRRKQTVTPRKIPLFKCLECEAVFCDEPGLISHMVMTHRKDADSYTREHEIQPRKTPDLSSLDKNYHNFHVKAEQAQFPDLKQEIMREDGPILGP